MSSIGFEWKGTEFIVSTTHPFIFPLCTFVSLKSESGNFLVMRGEWRWVLEVVVENLHFSFCIGTIIDGKWSSGSVLV